MVVGVATRKFTADEFHRMAEAGILHEDDRLELVDGEIVQMTPIGNRHASVVDRLTKLLVIALQDLPVIVRVQNPIRMNVDTEFYPDLAVVADRGNEYLTETPGPQDVHLLVEVSDSSLSYDRVTKASHYGKAGISEFWLVDVKSGALEVHGVPGPQGYSRRALFHPGDTITLSAFPKVQVAVEAFLTRL